MHRVWVSVAGAGLCVVSCGVACAGVWTPGLTFGARLDRNENASVTPSDYIVKTVTPLLGFRTAAEAWDVRALAARRFEFVQTTGAPASPVTDRSVDRARLHVGRAWSEVSRAAIDARYDRTHTLWDLAERTAFVPGDLTRWDASGVATLGRFEAEGWTRSWSYADRAAEDASAHSWSARFLPIRHREGAWFVGWHERRLELDGRTVVRSRMAGVGARRQIAPLLTGELEVGAAHLDFGDGARHRSPALVVGLRGVAGAQDVSTQWRLERDIAAAATAEIGRDLGHGRVWARGESLVDVEGGVYRHPTVTRRLSLGAQDTLARSMVLGFQASCVRVAPLHFETAPTSGVRASAWLVRRLRPWLDGRGEWSYVRLADLHAGGVSTSRRTRFDLTLTALWN